MIRRDFLGTITASGLAITVNRWRSSGERKLLADRLIRSARLPKHKLRDFKIVFITTTGKEFVLPVKDVFTTSESYIWKFEGFLPDREMSVDKYILLDDEFYKIKSDRFNSTHRMIPGDTLYMSYTFGFPPKAREPLNLKTIVNSNGEPVTGYTYKYKELVK